MAYYDDRRPMDRGSEEYIRQRTARAPLETPLPGVRYGVAGRVYPGLDAPDYSLKSWLKRRLARNTR